MNDRCGAIKAATQSFPLHLECFLVWVTLRRKRILKLLVKYARWHSTGMIYFAYSSFTFFIIFRYQFRTVISNTNRIIVTLFQCFSYNTRSRSNSKSCLMASARIKRNIMQSSASTNSLVSHVKHCYKTHTHTHTHTYIYIYIYIYKGWRRKDDLKYQNGQIETH
jgi:hypothetical protein